eukprot:GABV01006691.1.p1 GENE.GABV01006691.1~~GABV01006691.1.p1  ORF type:complete len:140 (-),score=52.97 GABV01006691.1:3-362(-)
MVLFGDASGGDAAPQTAAAMASDDPNSVFASADDWEAKINAFEAANPPSTVDNADEDAENATQKGTKKDKKSKQNAFGTPKNVSNRFFRVPRHARSRSILRSLFKPSQTKAKKEKPLDA